MTKKIDKNTNNNSILKKAIHKQETHPAIRIRRTFGQKAADNLTKMAGSWAFIISVSIFLVVWIIINFFCVFLRWDPYPFILLNFVLSTLAAMQAPVILMSQNRETERDRITFKYDYRVNRKAEREITDMQKDLEIIKNKLDKLLTKR